MTEAPLPPDRLSRVLTLLYYLLDEQRGPTIPLADIESDLGLSRNEVKEDLRLLNLVNYGGGTYLLYAEIEGNAVSVLREPGGEALSHPARLSPMMAKALLFALEIVGDKLPIAERSTLASAREKIRRLADTLDVRRSGGADDLLSVDSSVLESVNRCLHERHLLTIEYYTPSRDELSERIIEPYQLYQSEGKWYVEAYCRRAEAQRTFRLDLIRTATPLEDTFEPREEVKLDEIRQGAMGILEEQPDWALVKFPDKKKIPLKEAGLHVEPAEERRVRARIPYLEERWVVREVLGHLGDAVLEKPEELRKKVVEETQSLLDIYTREPGRRSDSQGRRGEN